MITYDPRNLEWDLYCSLMAELFSSNDIGSVPEERWREWVDGVSGIGYFGESGVPDHKLFDTWQAWAQNMVGIMTLRVQT
jgi:hypothetical protein|tara:strand:- start:17693 stop:17932 length:240 start_codon:yes stop_codon:yes gene_type:complete